ncbi:hypothetical protein BBK14_16420 [Parafrankia soli]|uniref:Uncharacterized protein n=1 Tax=Parafrankia soli TaxID=2599596 RepID=A0A1S1QFQ5_9ACTN|nr:Gfo/Idh/MocA family oxidoreductase [Parafrankia soli]OHV31104.1 hypothetical protein BBK14_16420 [Parafrankia soli]
MTPPAPPALPPVPPRPLRVVVCGTNFGRLYAEAVRALPEQFTLAGVLSRGSAYSRSYADRLGVTHLDAVENVPDDVEVAVVAVGSTVSGGAGSELAGALLRRGVHVLQEHPVHPTELLAQTRLARAAGVQYQVNTHYHQVEPVRRFLDAAARLRAVEPVRFVDTATSVHVLLPLLDILARALGGVRPWSLEPTDGGAAPGSAPPAAGVRGLRALAGQLGGAAVHLRVHNELDPHDRDNQALLWHRVTLGTDAGVLTLADTHGPVLWSPRLHGRRDADRRLLLDSPAADYLDQPSTATLPGTEPLRQRDVVGGLWPQAIRRALRAFAARIDAGADPLPAAQFDLSVARIWTHVTGRLGPPDTVRASEPRRITAADLAGDQPADDQPDPDEAAEDPAEPYTPTAEFFDLVAADHVGRNSAPRVVRALRGLDLGRGPVVEVGAGTGLLTEAVARAFPTVEIIAFEPAAGMRAVLSGRVMRDDDLRRRVTVSPLAAPDLAADLPDSISAALVCGVAGHLDAEQRRTTWRVLAERMAPGAAIVVELMNLPGATRIERARLGRADLGEQSYEWWFEAEPAEPAKPGLPGKGLPDGSPLDSSPPNGRPPDEGLMALRTTWRVLRAGEVVREVDDTYQWRVVDLRALAVEAGLAHGPPDESNAPHATTIGTLIVPHPSPSADPPCPSAEGTTR